MALGGTVALTAALGCGDDDGPAGVDSGTGRDAGGGTDAGGVTDAGGEEVDACGEEVDAGGDEVDAGGEDDAGTTPACESVNSTIGTNHGHTLALPAADVAAGTERTYDIQGASPHAHSVTVTAEQFTMLAAGMTVMTTSTRGGGHTHAVTLVCG